MTKAVKVDNSVSSSSLKFAMITSAAVTLLVAVLNIVGNYVPDTSAILFYIGALLLAVLQPIIVQTLARNIYGFTGLGASNWLLIIASLMLLCAYNLGNIDLMAKWLLSSEHEMAFAGSVAACYMFVATSSLLVPIAFGVRQSIKIRKHVWALDGLTINDGTNRDVSELIKMGVSVTYRNNEIVSVTN